MNWVIAGSDAGAVDKLAAALKIHGPAARVLCARGFSDPEDARRFLHPSLADLLDPYLLAGMTEAVARLRRALEQKESILLYGDYDVDGTSAIVILKKGLDLLGGITSFHVPHRLRDGYGMKQEVVEEAAAQGVKLIVSVDTGIRANDVVRHAGAFGIDVIVTDHHLPEAELPPAVAVLNPNRPDCPYPEKTLCGAGVALKLVQALIGTLGWPAEKVRRVTESFLKLVAIATVADVVPLTGENRVIVKHGLDGLNAVRNPGLRALLDVAGFSGGRAPSSRQVAFQIAPRMNAAGRMDTAQAVIEMFLTSDAERARGLAQQLHEQNAERQQVEAEIREACEQAAVDETAAALVYYAEDWHRGVLGIVASRMVEQFHRPVFVLSRNPEDGLAQGSGRSIPGFHLLDALESMADLFVRFGGHEHAAGVTLPAERVEEFRCRFNGYAAARLTAEDFRRELRIDGVIDLRQITDRSVTGVFELAPFGHGNPPPLFAVFGAEVAGPPAAWNEKHLRVMLRREGRTLALKAWNFAARAGELAAGTRVDAVFCLEEDAYAAARGYPGWCAVLRDVRAAEAERAVRPGPP